MKKLISDKELLEFATCQTSHEGNKELYAKAKLNKETDLLLHLQLATLACQSDLAEDLLGEDEFFLQKPIAWNPMSMAAKNIEINSDNK